MILEFFGYKFTTANSAIIIDKANYHAADDLLGDLKPKPGKPKPKKKRKPESYTGRPTFESQGKRKKIKLSVAIDAEANDYILNCVRNGELASHTLSRIILEHKRLTNKDKEIAEMAYRSIA